MFIRKSVSSLGVLLFFSGCSFIATPQERHADTQKLASIHKWNENIINTKNFALESFIPSNYSTHNDLITIFIEGDGFAWVTRHEPSDNPTPKSPVALKIALSLDTSNSAYLSRPCQNTFDNNFRNCTQSLWTDERFNDEIVDSMDEALTQLKQKFNAKKIRLVGYSGGGVIALLLANKRSDITKVITVASNIDTDAWVKYHDITPLHVKNPALLSEKLKSIAQIHYVGSDDEIVPLAITQSYISHFPVKNSSEVHIVDGFTHYCCWEDVQKYWIEK